LNLLNQVTDKDGKSFLTRHRPQRQKHRMPLQPRNAKAAVRAFRPKLTWALHAPPAPAAWRSAG
jgi:hypothetical protein